MTATIPATPSIEPEPGSRLAELCARYAVIKPLKDDYERQLKEITNAIKLELTTTRPDADEIRLESEELPTPLRVKYIESWRINTDKLKAEFLDVYVQCAKRSDYWDLRAVK